MKRQDYITWDEYFMGVALLAAERSKDPNTQVGACIADEQNRILSVGYNPAPLATKGVKVVGDASKVGNLRTVIWQAWDVAMKI